MFQLILVHSENYDVLAMPNLNGDYVSDALSAQVGGLGVAPGANIGDGIMIAEPVHGTAPDVAGENTANPTAMMLSGTIMFDHIGWEDAAQLVFDVIKQTFNEKKATIDIAHEFEDGEQLSTDEFADAVVARIESMA